ncbi:hypothetical protein BDM02DRAFT_3182854 [Thelephora ganbajun]|uniref:Uncharacterized protein n=1 Tax=Thelephora ganbajun TaxID=370292 RepID=A0ACB6ZUJ8_THEGA|nr:hypothetical protein BDM02DRAFT_3182854 [Thelephora ganbajun]
MEALRTPNIVPLLGATTYPFQLISGWMPGSNLTEHITNHPDADRLGLVGASRVVVYEILAPHQLSGVAEGLNYFHSRNMIHGDLNGVLDFTKSPDSISIALGDQGHTVQWTAPEILNKQGIYSKEADIFSFAMITIEHNHVGNYRWKATATANPPNHDGLVMGVDNNAGSRKLASDYRRQKCYDGPWGFEGANILIDQHGHTRLVDFGLLTIVSDPTNPTVSSSYTPAGTTKWMSPELLDPERFGPKDGRLTKGSDCHALGMVIYEVLNGRAPFALDRDCVVIRKVIEGNVLKNLKVKKGVEAVLECLDRVSMTLKTPPPSADGSVDDPPQAITFHTLTFSSSTAATLPPTLRKHQRSGSSSDSQWTSDALIRRASLEANIVRDLVNLFFTHCHPGRMMVHKPTFMAALSQNRVTSHLILAMSAMSAPFSQSLTVKSQPPRLAGIKFYEDAVNILFDSSGRLIREANLQTVQTLCLLEMHDVVAQHSWTKCYRYLDIATKILFETLDIASPESPPLSPKPTIQEMTRMTERESCTRNVGRFSAENMLMRLPVHETSFELGIQSQTPEHLDEMAPKTNYAPEFGHLTRITALFSQMEEAVGIVDDDDRFVSAMQEAKTALRAWEDSLPEHLRYTEENLYMMSSVYETAANTGPWCFFYMHALHSYCEMSASSEMQKRFTSGRFVVPKQATDAGDRCLRILKSVDSRAKDSHYLVTPALWIVSRYFKDNAAMLSIDSDFETVWGWKACEISETWRRHNEARKLEVGQSQRTTTGGSEGPLQQRRRRRRRLRRLMLRTILTNQPSSSITSRFPEDLER